MTDVSLVPYIPDRQELEAMTLAQRVALEDVFGEATDVIRSLNDAEIARLAEAGATQRAIGQACGKSQAWVRIRLGLREANPVSSTTQDVPQNGDGPAEVVDAEVVDDDPNERPAHHLPDVVADDADQNLRTTAVRWFEWGRDVEKLLEEGAVVEPKDRADKAAIKREAAVMAAIARRLKGAF